MFRLSRVILLFMAAPLSGFAQSDPPCWSAKDAEEYGNCLVIERIQRETELDTLYKKALTLLETNAPTPSAGYFPDHVKAELVQAQSNWKKFVEADCVAVFARTYPGRAASTEQDRCRITHIKRRIKDLQEWAY